MAINGVNGAFKAYGLDFTGKMTVAEAKAELANKGVTVSNQVLEAAADAEGNISGEDLSRIAGQYGTWQTDISTMWKKSTGTLNKEEAIATLKTKYGTAEAVKGDKYAMTNPQLQGLKKLLDAGEVTKLGEQGFSRTEIVEIINSVFPDVGIKTSNNSDKIEVPNGHPWNRTNPSEANQVYTEFINQLSTAAGNTSEITALENQLNRLTTQLNNNVKQTNILKTQIDSLTKKVEKEIEDALDEAEAIEEKAKQDAKAAVKTELDKYSNSNGKMTYSQYQTNVTNALAKIDVSGKLAAVTKKISDASASMTTIKNLVDQIGNLNTKNENIRTQMGEINKEISTKRAQATTTAKTDVKRTDPIGFTLASGVKLDFFIDKDNSGDLSNEKEFLGAENGWKEMTSLDTSGDGIVDYAELAAKENLKLVVTNKDGKQEVKNIADIFENGDSINLNSYKAVGTEDENANILQGTFTLNTVEGVSIEGYQTLDTLEWLDENYNFSDADKGIGRFAQGIISALEGTEVTKDEFTEIIKTLTTKLTNAQTTINGLDAAITADKQAEVDAVKTQAEAIRDRNIGGTTDVNDPKGTDNDDDDITIGQGKGVNKTKKSKKYNYADLSFSKLESATKSTYQTIYKNLKDTINDNYSGQEKISALNDLRKSFAEVLQNLFSDDIQKRSQNNSAKYTQEFEDAETTIEAEIAADEDCKAAGITYEKHKIDIKSGTTYKADTIVKDKLEDKDE